jgi:hypothetical protein
MSPTGQVNPGSPRIYGRTDGDAATPRKWNIICWRSFNPLGFFMIFL